VIAVVGEPQRLVRSHVQAVRPVEDALAPGAEEVALAVEHHHGMPSAIESIHAVLGVDAHRGHVGVELLAGWQLRPPGDDLGALPRGAQDLRHGWPPLVPRDVWGPSPPAPWGKIRRTLPNVILHHGGTICTRVVDSSESRWRWWRSRRRAAAVRCAWPRPSRARLMGGRTMPRRTLAPSSGARSTPRRSAGRRVGTTIPR